jgi:hypothetical protein
MQRERVEMVHEDSLREDNTENREGDNKYCSPRARRWARIANFRLRKATTKNLSQSSAIP